MDAKALVRQMIALLATDPERKTWEGEYAMVVKAVRIAYPTMAEGHTEQFVDNWLMEHLNLAMA